MDDAVIDIDVPCALAIGEVTEVAVVNLEIECGVVSPADQGPPGPRGADGSPGTSYEHTQVASLDTWTVNHNLGFWPTVTVFGPGNSPVNAGVLHTSLNQCVISFVVPMTGTVRCN